MLLRRTSMLMSVLQTILLLICKAALTTALPCYEPCLYYAKLSAIRRLPLQNSTGRALTGTPIQTVYSKGQHINAIAIDRYTGRMFWYDIITRMIYRANLNGSDSQVIVRYGVGFCEGIAYDWSTDNIYWTDIWHKWIGVASSDGKNRKIIAIEATLQPAGIIVAPNEGFLFWTALGRNAKIERARLDGTERKAILTTGLYMPHDLQIDYSSRRLYWIDAILDKVASSDYDGKNRIVVTDVSYFGNILMHPYSMALFAQHSLVYFTDWYRSWVLHKSINGNLIYTLSRPIPKILQIGQVRILHNSTQPPVTSQCLQNKGNCSHLCIKHIATRYTCQCPTGTVLATYNSTQCQRAELDYQLFVVEGLGSNGKILHLSKFVGQPQYEFEGIKLPQSSFPVGLDFDQDKNMLYWTDVYLNKLFRMHVNGSGFQTLIDTGIETPETVQLDPATGLLYITDYNYEKIEVIKMDGSMRMDLITTDIVNPRDLVLYHEKGIMFYSDWHPSNPKIESMYMDGTSRKYIISSDISAPSGLAIDKVEQRIYWCDMQLDRIESSDLDGRNRRVLFDHYDYDPNIPLESVTGEIQLPYGLTLHQEKVFWTDWGTRAVYSADKRIGNTIDYITRVSQRPMQVHAYSKKKLKEYKKLYFFARAKKDLTSTQTHACFSKNCTGVFSSDPQKCPVGYNQTGFKEVCANCSAPFGVYNLRCECKNWMSCAHRAYSELSCPSASPFMQFKVRECTQVVNPGHCPNTNCPKVSQPNCTADGDCLDTQKCCNTSCGMKCLSSATSPGKHPCQTNNGGCSHFCFRIPNNFRCRCPGNMTLQPADNKTCILKSGLCAGKQPCLNGGICRDANTTAYNCSCKNGFFGRNCEKCPECPNIATCTKIGNIAKCKCISNVCQNNGSCTFIQNRTVCHCSPGFTGANCETALFCPSSFCTGHGNCYIKDGAYNCSCYGNYSGRHCEIFTPCLTKECKNNGTCIAVNGRAVCNCTQKFTGPHCDIFKPCVPNPCANGGVCSRGGSKAVCTCKPGYTGEKCGTRLVCYSSPCLNNGTCYDSGGKASCRCRVGYTGDLCQTYNPCSSNPCKNGANCSIDGGSISCQCLSDFTGRYCETKIRCPSDFCKNRGTCQIVNSTPKCKCPDAYLGVHCETHRMCSPNPCQNGGNCSGIGVSSYSCSCPKGYTGMNCQFVDRCLSNPCKNGGSCTNLNSGTGYKCNCTNDYVGQNCESINVCASNPCLNLGTCQVGEAGYTCKCVSGYKGKNCATRDYCASSNCRQSSLCVNGQTGYTCSCDTGYTGQYCDTLIDRCGGGDICKNKGVCTSTLQKAICTCDDYYGGETCEVYYGESVMEVTLNVTSSSNVTAEVIKSTIAKEYTNFCRTTDCAGSLKAKRKKRDTTSAVVLTSKDIMIPSGYPKMVTNSRAELQYAIIINAAGKSSALPEALLYRGFEAVKDGFSKSLNAAVAGYQIVKKPSNGKSTSKATSSSKGGLAAGLVVLALVLIFVIVIALYVLRKRRREKEAEIDFNRFDNVLYQSNTDLQDKKTPDVILNRRTNDGAVRDKKQQQFSNVVYDARQSYSEMENAELGASLDLPVSDNTVEVDMKEGMVGMVNPYMEAVESDRKSYPLAKTDSATISSSTNLKASVLASLDDESAMQFGSGSMLSGRSFNRDNERPMVVKVRSVGDDSVDGQSGFANPCAAVDDYIFSEDDTREAVDVAVHNSTENKQSPDESFPSRGDEPNRESSA